MVGSSAWTLRWAPRLIWFSLSSANQGSTRLSHEALVGRRQVETRMPHETAPDARGFVSPVIIEDEMHVEVSGDAGVDRVHVLHIDDDCGTLETFGLLLTAAGYDYTGVAAGLDGIDRAAELLPDVAIVDLRLPDLNGVEVVRRIRMSSPTTRCVLLTGFWDIESEFLSKECGASACVEKPLFGDEVVALVARALTSRAPSVVAGSVTPSSHALEDYATSRIVEKIVTFIESPTDERTLRGFGRRVGISAGGFRNWCRTRSLRAKRVLAFSRALRAICRHQRSPSLALPNIVQIVDQRTIRLFIVRAGGAAGQLPASVQSFLERQSFVDDKQFVDAVREALLNTRPDGRTNA